MSAECNACRRVIILQLTTSTADDQANKHEYIQKMCEFKITLGIKPQLEAFLSGFHELIPLKHLSPFDDKVGLRAFREFKVTVMVEIFHYAFCRS